MSEKATFKAAYPYQDDVLALPVTDLDQTSQWYCNHFAMTEIERRGDPTPTLILERDGTQIGFAINGGDASQDGAAILIQNIQQLKSDFQQAGLEIANTRIDERDGEKFEVFFVVAPDGLCFYFHEPIKA